MINNALGDFKDEVVEQFESIPKIAKKQILGDKQKTDDKVDPITNKPKPSKKIMTQLTQATAQLAQTKLKKIREELDKQRLKVIPPEKKAEIEQKKMAQDDAIAATLRNAQSTGEMGKNIGG